MWWLIGSIVIGLIIYSINNTHRKDVKTHISNKGGMLGKYSIVIKYLKSSGLQVYKITKDSIILTSHSSTWTLDYVGNNLEVRIKTSVHLLGDINKKWIFSDEYPQEKMIEEFENYFDWQMKQLKKVAESNFYQYLNNE